MFFSQHKKNGWIDKNLFSAWATMFCDWLNKYREEKHNAKETITLLLDSHNSRANTDALEIFKACNVRVITFPPHCTHALQPFDVCIAKKLKNEYTNLYEEAIRGSESGKIPSSKRREIAVDCIITAWKKVVNYKSAFEAFRKTGMHPFDAGAMLMARGVNTITGKDYEKEERKTSDRLFISSSDLTSDEMMIRIREHEEEQKEKQAKKKVEEISSKSLEFKVLDPNEVTTKYNDLSGDSRLSTGIAGLRGFGVPKLREKKRVDLPVPLPKPVQIPKLSIEKHSGHLYELPEHFKNKCTRKVTTSKVQKVMRSARIQIPYQIQTQNIGENHQQFKCTQIEAQVPSPAPSPLKILPLQMK